MIELVFNHGSKIRQNRTSMELMGYAKEAHSLSEFKYDKYNSGVPKFALGKDGEIIGIVGEEHATNET